MPAPPDTDGRGSGSLLEPDAVASLQATQREGVYVRDILYIRRLERQVKSRRQDIQESLARPLLFKWMIMKSRLA